MAIDPGTVVLLGSLVKEYGPKVGRVLNEQLQKNQTNLKQILKDLGEGMGVTDALKNVFKDKFETMIADAQKTKKLQYETGWTQYISLDIDKNLPTSFQNDLLKAELAENLERLDLKESNEVMNNARSIVNQWLKKYVQIKNPDHETLKKIQGLSEILRPGKTNGKDLFKKLKPLFGLTSFLSLLGAAVLATGAGMGVFVSISLWLTGMPFGQVLGAIGLAAISGYLALVPVKEDTKIQLVINGIYSIIDDKIEDFSKFMEEQNLNNEQEKLFKDLQKRLETKNFSNTELMMVMTLLKHMVLIDGNEHNAEVNVINEYFKEQFTMNDEEIKNLYAIVPEIENVESFVSELKEQLSNEEIESFLSILRHIVVADKKIDPNEVTLLKEITKYF